jgi:DNA-binding XRE family transcriptional regulator
VRHSDTVAVLLRALGQQLAALRREAGLTQEDLAALMAFSRSTVSVAEIGHQPQSREFWAACDKALDTGGVLAAGCDQIHAVRQAEERAAARAAQQTREARALAAFTAAQQHDGVAAGVTAVQPCPQCGCQVAVLTTLIQQPPVPATAGNANDTGPSRAARTGGTECLPALP